jgi:uncharacterized repeat protein (TIGR01451 family)
MSSSTRSIKPGAFVARLKVHALRTSFFFLVAVLSTVFTLATATVANAALLAAVTIIPTKSDVIINDGVPLSEAPDGKADPGEIIQYTVVVPNSGSTDATGVTFNDVIDAHTTLVAGSVDVSPLAINDTYDTIGNTLLDVGVSALDPAVHVAGSLFTNDMEFLGDTFDVAHTHITSHVGPASGTLTLDNNAGTFTYLPNANFTGTDSFTYTLTDSAGLSDTATVTINVINRVWYVKNDAAAGDGRSSSPFNTLAGAQAASAANDTIYIFHGDGATTGQNAGITLKAGQRLIGEGVALTVPVSVNGGPNPTTLRAAGSQPLIGNAGGFGVSVPDISNVQIFGLNIAGSTNAVNVTTTAANSGSFELANNTISSAGANGIDVNGGGTGALTVNLHDNTVTASGNGIDIQRTAGSVTIIGFANNVVTGNTVGTGINIVGTGATVVFDSDTSTAGFQTVLGGATAIGQSGNGVGTSGLVLNNVRGDLSFSDLDIYADGGSALFINSTTPNFNAGTSTGFRLVANTNTPTLAAIGGAALDVTDAAINIAPTTFSSSITTANRGVALLRVSGALSAPSGSITSTNASGVGFFVDGGNNANANVAVAYGGTINADIGRLVQIQNVTAVGATYAFSGAITDNNDGDGGETGVFLNGNTGATITFSGGLAVRTTTAAAFTATGGGTISATQNNTTIVNTLTSTTGAALNVANTTIGASGLTFRSISANGAANGIVLNATSASGGLTVSGNGGTCTSLASTCTGGTIQATTGHGISLTSTQSPSFNFMKITNIATSGISGTGVINFTLANSVIDGVNTSHTTSDGNVSFNQAGATVNNVSGTVSITSNTLDNSYQNGIQILNNAGTISNLTITNNSLTSDSNAANSVGSAIQVLEDQGTSATSVTAGSISGNTIHNFPSGGGIVVHIGSTAVTAAGSIANLATPLVIQDNVINGFGPGAAGLGTNGVELTVGHQVDGFFTVGGSGHGNTITNVKGDGIACSKFGNNGGAGSTKCSISFNTIVANNTANSPGINTGADSGTANTNTPTLYLNIHNNNVSNTTGNGILSTVRSTDGTGVFFIQNNTVAQPTSVSGTIYGIRVDSGNNTEATGATVCLKISGNTTVGSTNGSLTAPGIGLRQNHAAVVSSFQIDGLVPASANDAQMEAYVGNAGQNPGSANGTFGATGVNSISGGATYTNSTCIIPGPVAFFPTDNTVAVALQPGIDKPAAQVAQTVSVASAPEESSKQVSWANSHDTSTSTAFLTGNLNSGAAQLISAKLPAPAQSNETVNVSIGALPAGKSVTIVFRVTVDPLGPGEIRTRLLNQGTVSGSNFSDVLTTNGGPVDCETDSRTCTPVDRPNTTVSSISRSVPLASPDGYTNASDVTWRVTFANAVAGLASSNFTLLSGGTLSGTSITSVTAVGGAPATAWDVLVHTGTGDGLLELNMTNDTGLSHDVTNLPYTTGEDYNIDKTAPTVTINQAAGQSDPTNGSTINFTAVFSESVGTSFAAGDVTLSGTAGATTTVVSEIAPMDGTTYNVAVSSMTGDGGVIASILANKAQDLAGNNNTASTSTDNTVTYDTTAPTVTIDQAVGQSDPTSGGTINFTAVFSESVGISFAAGDVTLSGTAGATTATVTEIAPNDGTTYDVAVSGMTNGGTVIASILANKAQDLAGNNNTASTSADNTVTYVPPTDLSITKTDGVTTAVPGGSVTYTITAGNSGPNADPSATVADTFPASLTATWTCAGAGGGTCTASGSGNINDTVNLPVGGSVTYTVSASISASATGTLSNTATVSSSIADTNPGNNSATDTDTLNPQADLSITKTDGVTTAVPGGSVTYTITASNAGPSNAPGATVADTFPASLTPTWTCAGAGGGTCTASGSGNINDTVNLPAGGSVTYTVSASVSAAAAGTLSNTATVTTPGGVTDPTPGNNSATDTDTLSPQADLSITKTDGVTIAVPGGSVTYTITVSNAGPSNAPGATVADTFPASLTATWTCAGAGGGTCTASGSGNINDTVNLPAGGSVTYTAIAAVSISATGTLSNTATVTAPGGVTDPTPGNNSATDSDTAVPPVDVTIDQAPGQADPTNIGLINFRVVFASAVTDFNDTSDVTLSGTAGATTVAITPVNSTIYDVAVSGMTGDGTVIATIAAGVATGSQGEPNAASTSTDNTVTYDATAPDTTLLTNPANPTSSTSAAFTFSGNDGSGVGGLTFECNLDGGGFNACTTPKNYPGPLADGSHTFQVRAKDSLGNTDPTPATYTWVVDTTAPNTTITGNPTNPSNSTSATFNFTGNDGVGSGIASFECDLDGGGFSACSTGVNYTALLDGSHTFQVRAIDNVGLTDPTPASFTWVVDTVDPTTSIIGTPSNPTASTSAVFTFTGADTGGSGVASFECDLDGGGFSACTSPKNYVALIDGSHTFQVRAIDNAGNTDASPVSFTWVVDATAPDTNITNNPFPTGFTNLTGASFSFTGNDGTGVDGLTFECKLDTGSYVACVSPQSYSGLLDGIHTFSVRAKDSLGNTDPSPATYSWTVDTVKPSVTLSSLVTSPTNTSPILVTITFSEPVDIGTGVGDLSLTNSPANPVISGGPTVYTFNLTPSADGPVTAKYLANSALDAAGNSNTDSNTISITYDTVSPTVTINQKAGQADPTSATPINFTATFSEVVTGFTGADVDLSASTAPGTLSAFVTGSGATYNVAVSGMTGDGTVIASIPAKAAFDAASNGNDASTSTDNSVSYIFNLPPIITEGASKSVTMSENSSPTPFALTLHATDANLDSLTWSILTSAAHGAASAAAGPANSSAISYTPLPNYNGVDSFVVQVSDGHGGTDSITVNVIIQPRPYNGSLLWNQSYDIQYDTWFGVVSPLAFSTGELESASAEFAPNASTFASGYRRATSGTFTFAPKIAFTQMKWITYRGPDQGKAQVIVDGVVKASVDLYSATVQWQYLVTISGLTNAKHTVVIKALNAKNALSTGKWVVVDGFKIGATSYDDDLINTNTVQLTYGTWLGLLNPGALYGAYRISSSKNATLGFNFDGVTFDWITARGPACGKAAIYVDGVLVKTVDLYKASQQWQYKVTIAGLTYGNHTVVIKVLGTKNPASTGTCIVSDGFVVN